MEIRYLRESDNLNSIGRIYEKSWKYAYQGIIPMEYMDSIPQDQWGSKLRCPGRCTLVCKENETYIGTASFGKSRLDRYPESGEIISLYLLPEFIGKGYGKQLMEVLLLELQKQGYQEVYLWVLEENLRARRFYEKMGFVHTGEYLDNTIGGKALREVRYLFSFSQKSC